MALRSSIGRESGKEESGVVIPSTVDIVQVLTLLFDNRQGALLQHYSCRYPDKADELREDLILAELSRPDFADEP